MNTTKEMIKAYIVGHYQGRTQEETWDNIRKVLFAAEYLQSKGYNVFCPHANFVYIAGVDETVEGREKILEMCCQWLRSADVVFFMPGWKKSKGSVIEHRTAKMKGIRRKYLTAKELSEYNSIISPEV